jgi:hypothetical protein
VKVSHNIAAIDVHKKLLVVVIANAAKPDVPLQSRKFGGGAAELRHLSGWLAPPLPGKRRAHLPVQTRIPDQACSRTRLLQSDFDLIRTRA